MRTPLLVVTGVHPVAIDAAMLSLAWDLPDAVSVRHHIDPVSQLLTRTVSDAGGVVDRAHVQLEHACVSCVLREDILPTLEALARQGRWGAIVAGLPTATEAGQLVHALGADRSLARRLKLNAVVTALSGPQSHDLLSDDLLSDRGTHTAPDDERGVGEVASAQVEFADVIVLGEDPGPEATDLVAALARPDATVVVGVDQLDTTQLLTRRRNHSTAEAWCVPHAGTVVPPLTGRHAWRLDLSSPRPFHPDRLLDQIDLFGSGDFRSRGVFWLPSRPGDLLDWSGAGGQLSIGNYSRWGRQTPLTRLIVTGLGPRPAELAVAFEDLLLTPTEALLESRTWDVTEDGLEPWLGDIRDAA